MAMRINSKTNNNSKKVNVLVAEEGQNYKIFGVDDCNYKVVDKKAYRKAANQMNVLNTLRGNKPISATDPKFDTIMLNKQIIGQHIHALNNVRTLNGKKVRTLYGKTVHILKDEDVQISFDINNKTLNIDIPVFEVYANLCNIYKSSNILNEHDALYNLLHAYNPRIIDHTGTQGRYVSTPELISSTDKKSINWKYANVHSTLDSSEKDIQECLMRSIYSRFSQAQISRADAYMAEQLTKLMNLGTDKTKDEIDKREEFVKKVLDYINNYIANNVDRHIIKMDTKMYKTIHYACGHDFEEYPRAFEAFMCERISIKVDSLVSKTDAGKTVYATSNVTKLRELTEIDKLLMSL